MAGEVRVPVFVSVRDDATQKLQSQLGGLTNSFKSFRGIVGSTIGVIGSFGAAIGAAQFFSSSIDQAKNLERSLLSVDTVFGQFSGRIEDFSKTSAAYGLSQSEAAKASVFLGSVLKQSGFDMQTTVAQTEKLVLLGADLAATYGYDVQEALMGMTALFRGEYDPIEKFGVAMKQSEINAELAARGQDKLTGAARRLAEQQIRLELLFQRSQDAQGAFARGQGTLYVESEKLRAAFENMQAAFAVKLTPAITTVMVKLQELVPVLGDKLAAAVAKVDWESLVESLVDFATYILENIDSIAAFVGKVAELAAGFIGLKIAVEVLTVAFAAFNAILKGNLLLTFVSVLAVATPMIIAWGKEVEKAKTENQRLYQSMAGRKNSIEEGFDRAKNAAKYFTIEMQGATGEINRFLNIANSDALKNIAKGSVNRVQAAYDKLLANQGDGEADDGTGESQFTKVQKIIKNFQSQLVKLERDYLRTKFQLNRTYEEDVKKLRENALKDQEALLEESQNRLRSAFVTASKLALGDIFSRETTTRLETTVQNLSSKLSLAVTKEIQSTSVASVGDMIEALNNRLTASRALVTSATELASKGFSQTFIEEILATGVETGNELATAILGASPEMQDGLRKAFIDLETVSETGLDNLSKTFDLATRDLNERSLKIADALNTAIAEKQQQLATALADAAYMFGISVGDLKDEFNSAIDGLDGKLAGLGNTIDALLGKMSKLQQGAMTDVQAAITGEGGALAGATVSNIDIKKEALNASAIVIDSAADLASTSAYIAARVKAAETYIKSASSGAIQEAAARAQIESWTKQLAAAQAASAAGSAAGTTININVKTDSSQSVAMVGKTLGNIVTKYVTTGGQVLVSGTR